MTKAFPPDFVSSFMRTLIRKRSIRRDANEKILQKPILSETQRMTTQTRDLRFCEAACPCHDQLRRCQWRVQENGNAD
jgi:hypothetical protein